MLTVTCRISYQAGLCSLSPTAAPSFQHFGFLLSDAEPATITAAEPQLLYTLNWLVIISFCWAKLNLKTTTATVYLYLLVFT